MKKLLLIAAIFICTACSKTPVFSFKKDHRQSSWASAGFSAPHRKHPSKPARKPASHKKHHKAKHKAKKHAKNKSKHSIRKLSWEGNDKPVLK